MNEAKQDIVVTFRGTPEQLSLQDIVGYQLGSGFLGIQDKDGTMHIFPSDRIESAILTQAQ